MKTNFSNGLPADQIHTSPSLINGVQTHVRDEVTDEVKQQFSQTLSFSKVLGHYSQDYYYNVYNIYQENTSFFYDNIKTSYLQSINKTLADNIIDNNTYFQDKNGEMLKEIMIDGYKLKLDKFVLEETVLCGNLYGKCLILPHLEGDDIILSVVHPWQYRLYDDEVHMLYFKLIKDPETKTEEEKEVIFKRKYEKLDNGMYLVKDTYAYYDNEDRPYETKNFQTSILPCMEINSERMFTDGVLELSLVHSATWTSLFKDIQTGASMAIFDERMVDKLGNANNKRLNYVSVGSASSIKMPGEKNDLFYSHYAPSIRSTDHDNIIKTVENKTASIMNLPISVISSSTATGEMVVDSKTAKRFNKTKKLLQEDFNKILEPVGYTLVLQDYENETKDSIIKSGVLLKQNTLGTQLPILKKLYSDKPDEWVMKEYLKAEIKSNTPLTDDEKEKAIELGLTKEVEEPVSTEESAATEEGGSGDPAMKEPAKEDVVGDKQMENADKVNIQGVASTDQ